MFLSVSFGLCSLLLGFNLVSNTFDVGDLVKYFNESEELYGIITRFGSIQGGHSTYYIHWFSNNEWSNESDWLEWEYEIKRI